MGKYDVTKEIIMGDFLRVAKENNWDINPNKKVVKAVCNGFVKNFVEYGYKYCPCVIMRVVAEEKRKDYICPCVNSKTDVTDDGRCHCNLFFRKEEKS